jgi:hypothetical protein
MSIELTRRHVLQTTSCGFGYLALQALCADPVRGAVADLSPVVPSIPARARRVIFLCMSGGPAHLDTFGDTVKAVCGSRICCPRRRNRLTSFA